MLKRMSELLKKFSFEKFLQKTAMIEGLFIKQKSLS